jgi:hypothetical protein
MFNYGPRANYGAITNCDSAQNTDARADPYVRPNCNRRHHALLLVNAAIGRRSMIVIGHKATRCNHRMIANHRTIADVQLGTGADERKIANVKACRI